MCIAIYKPANKTIPTSHLRNAWAHNPHGAGYAHTTPRGTLLVRRALTWTRFAHYWETADHTQPMLIHFRKATHGEVSLKNCHPFRIRDDLVMIHNGILRQMVPHTTAKRSDSRVFAEEILTHVPNEDVLRPRFRDELDEWAGWSRLVFLTNRGERVIVGEDRGHWQNGIWYSNDTYQPAFRQPTTFTLPTAHRRPVTTVPAGPDRYRWTRQPDRWTPKPSQPSSAALKARAHQLIAAHGTPNDTWAIEDLKTLEAAYGEPVS